MGAGWGKLTKPLRGSSAELGLRHDPQLAWRGFARAPLGPDRVAHVVDGLAFHPEDLGSDVRAPGPLLGEHTTAVLTTIAGYTDAEVEALRADGSVD